MENGFIDKIKTYIGNGMVSKLALLLITAVLSFVPFFSIQRKLRESIGNQPKMLLVIYLFSFFMVFLLVWIILKTRPKKE